MLITDILKFTNQCIDGYATTYADAPNNYNEYTPTRSFLRIVNDTDPAANCGIKLLSGSMGVGSLLFAWGVSNSHYGYYIVVDDGTSSGGDIGEGCNTLLFVKTSDGWKVII